MILRRASASFVMLALITACGGGGGDGSPPTGPSNPDPDPQPSSISVTPDSETVDALEDSVSFSATIRDQNGNVLSDVTVSWSSTRTSVATVNASGEAVARANGQTEIVAEAEGLSDRADLEVDQAASEVSVSPATDTLQKGEQIDLDATATDANGHEVEGDDFVWSSSDTAVATVDETGLVEARASGQVDISAELDGVEDVASISVAPGSGPDSPPTVNSVSPSPVPEGRSITISGSNFSSAPESNTVLIDGAEASVTSASTDQLEVDVPTYLCQPAREVSISVETSVGIDSVRRDLEPDESPIDLAAGEAGLASDPATFCFQFEETSGTERYLIGVQSASRTVGSLTPVQVTSEAADGSGAALRQSLSLAGKGDARPRAGVDVELPQWLRDHRRAEMRLRAHERELYELGAIGPSASLASVNDGKATVVSGVSVGDTVTMRVPDFSASNSCTSYREVGAVVRAIGTEGILVADTANPDGGFTDADYQEFSDRVDNDIIATQIDYFGEPSDLDNNGRIVALISKEVNVVAPSSLGFAFGGDLFSRVDCPSSDGGEIFYFRAPDPTGAFGDPFETEDARRQAPFIMAHEITHNIQQGRRFVAGLGFMDSWLAEAQATLSEEAVGHEVTGRSPRSNYGFGVAFGADADSIEWYRNAFVDIARYFGFESQTSRIAEAPDACGWWREDPSPCLGRALWYGVGWSFLRWISDHLGPSYPGGEAGLHRDIIDTRGDAWSIIQSVTGEDFNTLLATWAASLYLDDRVGGVSSSFTIPSWNFFDIYQNVQATARLQPFKADFSDWVASGDIRASSAGYILLEGSGRPATAVRITNSTDSTLPSEMQVFVIRLE